MRALLFTLVLASGGCIAEEPGTGGGGGPDGGPIEADAGEDEGVRLSVEGLPPQTYWVTVPLFGHGPANGTVIVVGPTDTVSTELGVDGSFCIDIPLDKGAVNGLEVVAIDASGKRSDPQNFEITQAGEPPDPGEPVPARNIALGGLPIPGSLDEEEGTYPTMTDGNRNTGVILQNDVFSSDWITVRMPTPDGVESIRIYGDEDCLMGDYLVHTSPSVQTDMAPPGAESVDVAPWTFRGRFGSTSGVNDVNVTDCSIGSTPCQEFNFDADVTGAIGIRFVNDTCSNFAGLGEHQVNEIEAWTPEGVAPPVVTAPSCSGGG
jgi:hypothetical protein